MAHGLFALLLPMLAAATDIYGYADENGALHFTNVPDSSRYKLVLRNPDHYKLKSDPRHRMFGLERQTDPSTEGQDAVAIEPPPTALFDTQRPFGEIIKRAAESNGIDPFLIAAVISVESAHNPAARSPKGAAGLMQLMPDTARRYGISDPYRAESNIQAGTRYLRDLIRMFNGDLRLALAGYNAGENAVIRYGNRIPPYPETLNYVPKVLRKYEALRKTTPLDI